MLCRIWHWDSAWNRDQRHAVVTEDLEQENGMERIGAVVLAAGSGKRMGADIPKQYLALCGKPVMVYCLEAFEKSRVDEIVLVVAPGDRAYCRKEIVEKYHITKVSAIVDGGAERYDSVYEGLKVIHSDYVLIHDCARAFVTEDIIERSIRGAKEYGACVVGMPVKDTIKIADESGWVGATPRRDLVWSVQTPQSFSYPLVYEAYTRLQACDKTGVTDDAMVVEKTMQARVKLIEGSYENIKVTTPEDLLMGERILQSRKK